LTTTAPPSNDSSITGKSNQIWRGKPERKKGRKRKENCSSEKGKWINQRQLYMVKANKQIDTTTTPLYHAGGVHHTAALQEEGTTTSTQKYRWKK
jgi:hypothetical protein